LIPKGKEIVLFSCAIFLRRGLSRSSRCHQLDAGRKMTRGRTESPSSVGFLFCSLSKGRKGWHKRLIGCSPTVDALPTVPCWGHSGRGSFLSLGRHLIPRFCPSFIIFQRQRI
jgi:hypothetical protein